MISNEKEFWTVGYSEWGRWQVRKSPVNDPYKWTLIEDLGPSLTAAYLEADGDFIYVAGLPNLQLVTSDIPWLVVITTSGKLYVKHVAEDLNNALLLDTGVLEASVCRGWRSEKYDVDSGLAVVYRKQTGAYLRVYRPIAGTYVWDVRQELTASAVNHVEIKRMNDYRFGILLDNQLMLSERFYIGGTAKTEYLMPELDDHFQIISMTQEDGPKDDLQIVEVTLHDNQEFWAEANYPFVRMDPAWDDISIVTTVPSGQAIDRFWVEDGYLKIRMVLPWDSPYSDVTFLIRQINRIQFERAPCSRPVCPEIQVRYSPPPVGNTEILNPVLTITPMISTVQKRNLSNASEERMAVAVSITPTIEIQPVQQLTTVCEEQLYPEVTLDATIVMQLVGDKPI